MTAILACTIQQTLTVWKNLNLSLVYVANENVSFSYVLKLLAICVVTVIFSETYFNDFSFTFKCPVGSKESMVFPENWPLNTTIPCVFTSLRVLSLIRYVDYILTGMVVALIVVGLM